MREIKFRAWGKGVRKMGQVTTLDLEMGGVEYQPETSRFRTICPLTSVELMQFTGLKDKNGKEIYEGDIIYAGAWGLVGYYDTDNYIVEFDEGAFRGFRREYYKRKNRFSMSLPLYKLEDIEILGNIYQNKRIKKP